MACPEEIALVVTGCEGEGGWGRVRWLVWAPLISDIWSGVALAAYLGQRSGLPSPSPDRHLGCSGETETTWWVASALIQRFPLHQSLTSITNSKWGKRISSSQYWVTNFPGTSNCSSETKTRQPTVPTVEWGEGRISIGKIVVTFLTVDGGVFILFKML